MKYVYISGCYARTLCRYYSGPVITMYLYGQPFLVIIRDWYAELYIAIIISRYREPQVATTIGWYGDPYIAIIWWYL